MQPIYGISILYTVYMRPVLLQPFYVIAILYMESPYYPTDSKKGTSALVDAIGDLNRSTSSIENLRNCRSIARSLLLSQHAVVYGQKASKLRSWMSRRKFTRRLQV